MRKIKDILRLRLEQKLGQRQMAGSVTPARAPFTTIWRALTQTPFFVPIRNRDIVGG